MAFSRVAIPHAAMPMATAVTAIAVYEWGGLEILCRA
jgi:hypothetical protein